jgi:hypothetical protein
MQKYPLIFFLFTIMLHTLVFGYSHILISTAEASFYNHTLATCYLYFQFGATTKQPFTMFLSLYGQYF